jgi:hypothetical protein
MWFEQEVTWSTHEISKKKEGETSVLLIKLKNKKNRETKKLRDPIFCLK